MFNKFKKIIIPFTIFMLAIGMNFAGFWAVGTTLAYYYDEEVSSGNLFTASSLDFSLSSESNFSPEASPTNDTERTVTVSNDGDLGFQYVVKTINEVGDLCPNLHLVAELDGSEKYSGPLGDFEAGPFAFSEPEEWNFAVSLLSDSSEYERTSCDFDFEFSGWQENIAGPPPAGFSDVEIISNIVSASADFGGGSDSLCAVGAPTIIIDEIITGTVFDYGDANVVVADGGAIEAEGSTLSISTDCDFTVEDGGEVRANGTNGGTISLFVGGDLSVAGDSIEAKGGSGSGTQLGGSITIDVIGDFELAGMVATGAQDSGGTIDIDVDGDFHITSTGAVLAEASMSASGTQTSGPVIIYVGGDFDVDGEVSTNAEDIAGDITITVGGDTDVSATGVVTSAASMSASGTQRGGDIDINLSGDFSHEGVIQSKAEDWPGDITVSAGGTALIAGTGANASMSASGTQIGGVLKIDSGSDMTVTGLIDVTAEDWGGIIELVSGKSFELTSTGKLDASTSMSASGTQVGGNISVIALDGDGTFDGSIEAEAQDRGGNIAVTISGDLTISDDVLVNAASSGSGTQIGGTVVFTTPGHLEISSAIESTAQETDGSIRTNYCTKDFAGATFDPVPIELTNCDSVVINEFLPNPSGSDDAAMPDGEWVELYNYGTSDVDVAGWYLYDAIDTHELAITAANTSTGDTIVPAGGFMVVYRDGDGDFALNNSGGDSVRLFDDTIGSGGVLRDTHSYTSSAGDDKSFARVPDGGVWYDPDPSPGESNSEDFDYRRFHFYVLGEEGVTEEVVVEEEEMVVFSFNAANEGTNEEIEATDEEQNGLENEEENNDMITVTEELEIIQSDSESFEEAASEQEVVVSEEISIESSSVSYENLEEELGEENTMGDSETIKEEVAEEVEERENEGTSEESDVGEVVVEDPVKEETPADEEVEEVEEVEPPQSGEATAGQATPETE